MKDARILPGLYAAIDRSDVTSVCDIITHHRDALHAEGWFNRALRTVARRDNIELVSMFVQAGAEINPSDDYVNGPEGPVLDAASEGAINAVRWLLAHGAKVNHQVNGVTRCLPLSRASWGGHLEVVKLLVEQGGADINAVWADNNALSFAIMYGQREVEAYLRSKGALEPWQLRGESPPATVDPILAHIEVHLGTPQPLSLREIVPSEPPISIHVVPMANRLALVTHGMSARPMTAPEGAEDYRYAELVIYLPPDWPLTEQALQEPNHFWPIEWLRRIALYPHANDTWLGGRAAIFANGEPPAPLAPNTKPTCLLAMTEESDFGWLRLSDEKSVAFYSLFPLYTEERDLEKAKGVEHLVRLFQERKVSRIVDINRPNVALPSGRRRRR